MPVFIGMTGLSGGRVGGSTLGVTRRVAVVKGPVHDPNAEDAIVLYRPKELTITEQMRNLKATKPILPQGSHILISTI